MSQTVEEMLSQIDIAFKEAKPRSINLLLPFAQAIPEPDEIFACFELWDQQYHQIGYNKFFVVKENDAQYLEIDWDEEVADKPSFLPEIQKCLTAYHDSLTPESEFNEAETRAFNKELESRTVNWFSECWTAAGGDSCRLPTYFCFEKEYRVRDIKTGKIMEETEAARLLGYDVVS